MERDGNVERAILAEMAKPGSPLIERVTRHNQIILHNFQEAVSRTCGCQLLGCRQNFGIKLVPNQVLYPKYCEEHRSEYRRQYFLKQTLSQPGTSLENVRVFEVAAE